MEKKKKKRRKIRVLCSRGCQGDDRNFGASVTHILLHTLVSCEPAVIAITINFQRFTQNDNLFKALV